MLEKIGPVGILTFLLSFSLGIICFFYIAKTLITGRVAIKVMQESLGTAVNDKSVILMVCVVLGVLGMSFFAICVGIYFFSYAVY